MKDEVIQGVANQIAKVILAVIIAGVVSAILIRILDRPLESGESFGDSVSGLLGTPLLVFLIAWAILLFVLPFIVFAIKEWTRKSHDKLASIDHRLAWFQEHIMEREEKRHAIAMECPLCQKIHTGPDERYCRECGVELRPFRAEKKPATK
ncbi:MAG: hypothetical protein Q8Q12_00525 [bacterium]|nr:hypothetical protein [bacterium]